MAEADVHFEILHAAERKHREGEILQTFREDLAEWMSDVLAMPEITSDSFFEHIENGGVLCRLAQSLHNSEVEWRAQRTTAEKAASIKLLKKPGCNLRAPPGSFFARDNLSGFLRWCSGLGVPDVQLFEPNDLVERKSDKNVLNSLMEIARHCHVQVPKLVQMEREIEQEMRSPSPPPPPVVPKEEPRVELEESPPPAPVQKAVKQIPKTLPKDELSVKVDDLSNLYGIRLIRVKKGQYKIANSSRTNKALFVRLLRSHVVVRVGGGWDTLEHYLSTHERVGEELNQVARKASSGSISEVLRQNAHDALHDPDAKADALGMTKKIGKDRIKVLASEVPADARLAKLSSVGYTSKSPTKPDAAGRADSPTRQRQNRTPTTTSRPRIPSLIDVGVPDDGGHATAPAHMPGTAGEDCTDASEVQRKYAAYMPSPTMRHRNASPSSPTPRPTSRASATPTGRRDVGRGCGTPRSGSASPRKRRGTASPAISPVSPRRRSGSGARRSDSMAGTCRLLKCQGRRGCVCGQGSGTGAGQGGGVAAAPASRARSFSDADLHRRVSPRLPRKGPGAIVASPVVPLEGNLSASSSPLRSSSTDPTAIRRDGTTVGATVAPEAGTPEPQSPLVSVAGPAQPRALVGDNKRHVAVPSQLASASTSVSTGLAIAPAAPRAVSPDSDPDGVCVWYQLENSMTGQAVGDVDCVIVDGTRTVRDLKLALKHARPCIEHVHVADMTVHLGNSLVSVRDVLCESEDIYTIKALLGPQASMAQMGLPASLASMNSPATLSAPRMSAPQEDMSEENLLKVLSEIELSTNM